MVGFQHFIIYDNTNNLYSNYNNSPVYHLLNQHHYISNNIVTYIIWPHQFCPNYFNGLSQWRRWGSQISGINSCINKFKFTTKWLGLFDVDEYLIPNIQTPNIQTLINNITSHNSNINNIGFQQKLLLNCSFINYAKYENKSITKSSILSHFQCQSRKIEKKLKKLIINPNQIKSILIHYICYLNNGFKNIEYILNNTNQGLMYHARSQTHFNKNEYYILKYDHEMLFWFEKIKKRLQKLTIKGQ